MTEPRRNLIGIDPESQVDPRNDPRPGDNIEAGDRFRSADYGDGTVVAILGIGIQIYWDEPLIGTADTHLLTHDKSFVARLERL